jgi:hypothetical protein
VPDRRRQLAYQPTQPPIGRAAGQRPAGIADHRRDLLQGAPGQLGDLTGEPVHLGQGLAGAPLDGSGQPLEAAACRASPVAKRGPGRRPAGFDPPDQPTELAESLRTACSEQVGVGRVVDVGLDDRGVHPQLAGPQQLVRG